MSPPNDATMTSTLLLHAAPAAGFDEPFAMLAGCHDRVRRSLALLQRLAAHLQTNGADDAARAAAADVLRYFDLAAPAHHEDEERHVLPVLRRAEEAALRALAARLHEDHERMAHAWAQVRPTLAVLAEGGAWEAAPADAIVARWQAFAALYDSHLEAEDGVAFPFAARHADTAVRAAMGAEMAQRRGVTVRPGPTSG
jgi:hemerythrin-like domain-containing protein